DRGPQVDVEIVGTYGFRSGGMLARASGLLVADRQADALGATAAAYFLSVPPDGIAASAERLGRALPEAAVLTGDDVNAYLARLFRGLFVFVLAIAGLAFGGGAVLIANTVGLSLVERRTELAVLKAVGYSSGRVLGLVAIETAIVGAFAGSVGAVGAVIAVQLVGASFDVNVSVAPGIAAAAAIGAALLAVATALVVASGAVRVRPLAVLRSGQ
ncbi:MAG: ABC transporter permease, partial [Bacteroidota bacterium]